MIHLVALREGLIPVLRQLQFFFLHHDPCPRFLLLHLFFLIPDQEVHAVYLSLALMHLLYEGAALYFHLVQHFPVAAGFVQAPDLFRCFHPISFTSSEKLQNKPPGQHLLVRRLICL